MDVHDIQSLGIWLLKMAMPLYLCRYFLLRLKGKEARLFYIYTPPGSEEYVRLADWAAFFVLMISLPVLFKWLKVW